MRRSLKGHTPDNHSPGDAELLALILRYPDGPSLRQIAGLVWPELPWRPAGPGADSAAERIRGWQAPRPGATGSSARQAPAAAWLRDRLDELVLHRALRHGDRKRDEVDALASITYGPTNATLRTLIVLAINDEGMITTPALAERCGRPLAEVDAAAQQLATGGVLDAKPLPDRPGLALRPRRVGQP